jgi:hypothetical protein
MNSNVIIRRIDQTCDIVGGEDVLRQKGFYHIVEYVDTVKKINELPFDDVLNLIRSLILDGSIYKEFALHIINNGLLHDKYFEVDEYLNPTKNNLNKRLKVELNSDYDDVSESLDSQKERSDIFEKEMNVISKDYEQLYESNSNTIETYNTSKVLECLNTIKSLTSEAKEEHIEWIKKSITNMSDADYGKFMVTISELRNSNKQ